MQEWEISSIIGCVLWGSFCGLLGLYRHTFRRTTLWEVYCWCVLAGILNLSLEGVGLASPTLFNPADWLLAHRLGVACALAPIIALLGAKRPQHKAWTWIVVSAVIVLALPAIESWLYRSPTPLGLSLIREILPWSVIAIGTVNYLGTANYWRGLLAGVGLTLMTLQGSPDASDVSQPFWEVGRVWIPPLLFCLAALPPRSSSRRSGASPNGLGGFAGGANHTWRRFQNWYGLAWSLFVLDKLNRSHLGTEGDGERMVWGWNGGPVEASDSSELLTKELRARLALFVDDSFWQPPTRLPT